MLPYAQADHRRFAVFCCKQRTSTHAADDGNLGTSDSWPAQYRSFHDPDHTSGSLCTSTYPVQPLSLLQDMGIRAAAHSWGMQWPLMFEAFIRCYIRNGEFSSAQTDIVRCTSIPASCGCDGSSCSTHLLRCNTTAFTFSLRLWCSSHQSPMDLFPGCVESENVRTEQAINRLHLQIVTWPRR